MVNKQDTIEKIFNILGGNSGLTEEFIYNNQPNNTDEEIIILSSATQKENLMGSISKDAKPSGKKLKIFSGPCIVVARNGYAGKMELINQGKFTTNDHAYVFTLKEEWKDSVDLRWFAYNYQELFFNLVTSKSDNATFNKQYVEAQIINLPDIKIQRKISKKLIELDKRLYSIEKMKIEIENVFNTTIE